MGFGGCLYFYFRYGNPVKMSRFFGGMVSLLRSIAPVRNNQELETWIA